MQAACLEAAEQACSARSRLLGWRTRRGPRRMLFSSLNYGAIVADISLAETQQDGPRDLPDPLPTSTALFSESPSRIIVSFPASSRSAIESIAERENCPLTLIGRVGGTRLRIAVGAEEAISANVLELESVWHSSLSKRLEAEVMAAGKE